MGATLRTDSGTVLVNHFICTQLRSTGSVASRTRDDSRSSSEQRVSEMAADGDQTQTGSREPNQGNERAEPRTQVRAGAKSLPEDSAPSGAFDEPHHAFRWILLGLVAAVVAATLADAAFAWASSGGPQPWAVFGAAVMFSGAAMISGVIVGFLFGIPRVLATPSAREADASAIHPSYAANTNLEEVSDWLTKLLLGAGLTQLGNIGSGASHLFQAEAPSLGTGQGAVAFAGAMTIYFLGLGFLLGWLLARLFLESLMRYVDKGVALAKIATQQKSPAKRRQALQQFAGLRPERRPFRDVFLRRRRQG
jgi:hypothetical protein